MDVVQSLRRGDAPSVSIGSSSSRMADVNVDIDATREPDVVADVLHLPFIPGIFKEALFTDVIEHLPAGTEVHALREINRILSAGGVLILSTPNNRAIFSILDLSNWLEGHRHYSISQIESIIRNADFRIFRTFTAGGIFTMLSVLRYCLVALPIRKLFGEKALHSPVIVSSRENREYRSLRVNGGYTIFCVATSN